MHFLAKLSITRKLIAITLLTTTVVVLLMAVVIVFSEAITQKRSLYQKRTEQFAALAEIIGSRSTAALIFDDRATAQENLNALRILDHDTDLVLASIHRPDGMLFAEYQASHRDSQLREQAVAYGCPEPDQNQMERLLPVCAAIMLDGERLGDVRLVFDMTTDLQQLRTGLIRYLFLVLLFLIVAFGLTVIISSRLQRLVSTPILVLREAMKKVSEDKDYSVRVTLSSDDELGALVVGFNDMLAQIQSRDAKLAQYSSQLEDEIAARTAELAEANRRRILWLENLARFLRHELKNSTIGIKSSLDLIERRSQQNEKIAKYIERANTSVSFMQRLLESVGSATTLETSFQQESHIRLDLTQLVTQQVQNYHALYPQAELITECGNVIEVLGNHTHLVQLLDKLVANAVDHCALGTPIIITAKIENDQAVLAVANQGASLPDDKERMFELFVSMRDATHRENDNLGLGLYLVKLIAEAHGGGVMAEELPVVQGALFTCRLPLAD
ncbi:MAG: ATP-binding protein [Candidatus Competibacteraceae bacterium]|jgi:signal transduction histidine kinase|nr:ATP-binding protein [Candidatus Competibacteraceae bacterium]